MSPFQDVIRHPWRAINAAIERAQTCPDCGCNADQWREDCDCTCERCECAGTEGDPDPDWEGGDDAWRPAVDNAEPRMDEWGETVAVWAGQTRGDWTRLGKFAKRHSSTGGRPEEEHMPAHIPAGREDLWRRQAESNAKLARLDAKLKAAEQKSRELAAGLGRHDSFVEDADQEVADIIGAYNREVEVNDRIYQERLAGLTSWIDHNPTAPICPDCKGTGGPPGADAHGACSTCRGWGREDRPPIPVWSEEGQEWINPATGQSVDLLADPAPAGEWIRVATGRPATTTTTTTTTTTATSGGTVASIAEVRAGIALACDKAGESLGALQQAHGQLEESQGLLMRAVEGSGQNDQQEALGLLSQAIQGITEVQQGVSAAIQSAEGVAARL